MSRRVRRRDEQRGFSMFVVTMIVALVSISALALLDVIRVDLLLVGNERQSAVALETAEGALMEVVSDEITPDVLPMFDDPSLKATYTPGQSSPFYDPSGLRQVRATASFLRVVPLAESSHTLTRAVVHEIAIDTDVAGGEASHEVSAEIYRTVTFVPGVVLPRRHAR